MGWQTHGDWVPVEIVSSMHPGGAKFAFCDRSVKFIKETIASLVPSNSSTGDPVRCYYRSQCSEDHIGTAKPQIYQTLAPATAAR
jgi:hypothetical protein